MSLPAQPSVPPEGLERTISYLPISAEEDNEKNAAEQAPTPLSLSEMGQKLWGPALFVLLFLTLVVLSLWVVTLVESGRVRYSWEKDVNLKIPPLSKIASNSTETIFHETSTFKNLTTKAEVDDAWGELGLSSHGLIAFPNPEKYNLSSNANATAQTENVYVVSVYHQLHCLKALHVALLPVVMGSEQIGLSRKDGKEGAIEHSVEFQYDYIEQCLDYLRQAIMCSGDVTLEPLDEMRGEREFPLQGWGVEHVCRSWESIEKWRSSNGVV